MSEASRLFASIAWSTVRRRREDKCAILVSMASPKLVVDCVLRIDFACMIGKETNAGIVVALLFAVTTNAARNAWIARAQVSACTVATRVCVKSATENTFAPTANKYNFVRLVEEPAFACTRGTGRCMCTCSSICAIMYMLAKLHMHAHVHHVDHAGEPIEHTPCSVDTAHVPLTPLSGAKTSVSIVVLDQMRSSSTLNVTRAPHPVAS